MASQPINRPDAPDPSVNDITPGAELESCNHLLDDHAALETFYQEKGYLLLRAVVDAGSVAAASDAMLDAALDLGFVEPGDISGRWTGVALPQSMEEGPVHDGIAAKVIEHPAMPHCGMLNRSDRLRITFDSRVQSARNPSAIAAAVTAATSDTISIDAGAPGTQTLKVDEDTFIRVLHPGVREPLAGFADYIRPGLRLVVVRDGDRAVMLRKASEG